jgi:hypothetical protein
MHLFIAHGFLSLDIANENHIGVPVINLCHNKKTIVGRSRKDPYSPHGGNFCRPEGEGRKNCF